MLVDKNSYQYGKLHHMASDCDYLANETENFESNIGGAPLHYKYFFGTSFDKFIL